MEKLKENVTICSSVDCRFRSYPIKNRTRFKICRSPTTVYIQTDIINKSENSPPLVTAILPTTCTENNQREAHSQPIRRWCRRWRHVQQQTRRKREYILTQSNGKYIVSCFPSHHELLTISSIYKPSRYANTPQSSSGRVLWVFPTKHASHNAGEISHRILKVHTQHIDPMTWRWLRVCATMIHMRIFPI